MDAGEKKRVENRSQKAIKTNDATKCDFHHVLMNYANEDEVMKVKIEIFLRFFFSIRICFLQQMRFSFCVNLFFLQRLFELKQNRRIRKK